MLQRAAAANEPYGLYVLGVMYENGYGVQRNLQEAIRLYKKADELGDVEAY